MANTGNDKKSRASVLHWLSFQQEARSEPAKPMEMGRFKFFRAVYKQYSSQLFVMNLMTAAFALPILFIIGLAITIGMENFGYAVSGINAGDVPYFLSNLGMGLSSGTSFGEGSVYLYNGYSVLLIACGICAPLLGIGISGLQHVTNKMMWQEKFAVKYGKIGNPIPMVYREYFKGIKENWWETVLTMTAAGGMFIGVASAYLNLFERLAMGTSTAWSWVGVVAGTIAAVYVFMTIATLIPAISQYHGKLNYLQKVKNSALISIGMFLPVVLSLGVIVGVVVLCSINTFFTVIGMVLAMTLGFAMISLMQTNVMHYTAVNIITPAYELVAKRNPYKEKAKKEKTVKTTVVQPASTAKPASKGGNAAQKPAAKAAPVATKTGRPNYKKKKK